LAGTPTYPAAAEEVTAVLLHTAFASIRTPERPIHRLRGVGLTDAGHHYDTADTANPAPPPATPTVSPRSQRTSTACSRRYTSAHPWWSLPFDGRHDGMTFAGPGFRRSIRAPIRLVLVATAAAA